MPASNPVFRHPIKCRTLAELSTTKGRARFLIQLSTLHIHTTRRLIKIYRILCFSWVETNSRNDDMINADISKKLSVTDVFCTPDKVNKNPLKKLCVWGFVWTTQQDWLNFPSPSFQVMNNTLTCTNVSDRQGPLLTSFHLVPPSKRQGQTETHRLVSLFRQTFVF